MSIADIEWTQGCCGESYKWVEVQVPSGWLRIKAYADGTYKVTQFGTDKRQTVAERVATSDEIDALI